MRRRRRRTGARLRPPARSGGGGGGAPKRRALAAHLRGHDHAADGAVHDPVLDLLGERLEVRDAAAVAACRVLRIDPPRRPLRSQTRSRRASLLAGHLRDPVDHAAHTKHPEAGDTVTAQAQAAIKAVQAQAPNTPLGISARELQAALQAAESASQEQADFRALQMRLNATSKVHGFATEVGPRRSSAVASW